MRARWVWVLLLLLALLAALVSIAEAAPPSQAATPPAVTDDQVNAVAKGLYCPVCENTPLDVCPTLACIQWRATIREKLAAGWTTQQIDDYFVAQYGERVLARPSGRGLNVLVWVIPPLVILAGVVILWRLVLPMVRKPAPAPATPAAAAAADEYAQRLEAELRKRI